VWSPVRGLLEDWFGLRRLGSKWRKRSVLPRKLGCTKTCTGGAEGESTPMVVGSMRLALSLMSDTGHSSARIPKEPGSVKISSITWNEPGSLPRGEVYRSELCGYLIF